MAISGHHFSGLERGASQVHLTERVAYYMGSGQDGLGQVVTGCSACMCILQVQQRLLLKSESKSKSEQLLISRLLGGGGVTVIGDPEEGCSRIWSTSRSRRALPFEGVLDWGEGGYWPAGGGWGGRGRFFSFSFFVFKVVLVLFDI